MTNDELDRLEALCQAATPGPWAKAHDSRYGAKAGAVVSPQGEAELGNWWVAACQWDADLAFIAASRTDLPALITEIRRLHRIEQAARAYVAWQGHVNYAELIAALATK